MGFIHSGICLHFHYCCIATIAIKLTAYLITNSVGLLLMRWSHA